MESYFYLRIQITKNQLKLEPLNNIFYEYIFPCIFIKIIIQL
jgi:hypothetical protein